jgi:phosphate transport system substrate-binding protein
MKNIPYVLIAIAMLSCNSQHNDTPTSGKFTIATDETYLPLATTLVEAYMAVYPQTVIVIDTTAIGNIYSKLDGKARAIITFEPLNKKDSIALAQRAIYPQSFCFANDALVFISKKTINSVDSNSFSLAFKRCEEMFHKMPKRILTDKSESENQRFLKSKYAATDDCFAAWFVASNSLNIITRIAKESDEVGMVSWDYLCEKKSPEVLKLRDQIDIIPFKNELGENIFPSQSNIALGLYPLSRPLLLVTAEPYAGPATGFAAYVASDEGQRIVRMFGLVPAKTPPREVLIKN